MDFDALAAPRYNDQLILQFELENGRNADAEVAAQALIAWVQAARAANAIMDPTSTIAVELLSADAACLRLWTAIKFIDRKAADASKKLDDIPEIKKLVVATVLGVPPALLTAGLVLLTFPDPVVRLRPEAQAQYHEEKAKVESSKEVQQSVQKFYKTASKDRAITAVSVSEGLGQPPILTVPRDEFPQRSGLWQLQEAEPATRPGGGIWNVVVTHPVAIGAPRTWGFMRDGLPFTAKVTDERFLAAIRDRTLPLVVQEGVMMQVQVQFNERLVGQTWEPVPGSWTIPRVISPEPRPINSGPPLPLIR